MLSLRANKINQSTQSAALIEYILHLQFEGEREAQIKVSGKETYLTFEPIALSKSEEVDLILWGTYSTTIKKIIGETVGVDRWEAFALASQSLNIKPLWGYPWPCLSWMFFEKEILLRGLLRPMMEFCTE